MQTPVSAVVWVPFGVLQVVLSCGISGLTAVSNELPRSLLLPLLPQHAVEHKA